MNHTLEWSHTRCGAESCEGAPADVQFNVVEVLRIAEELELKAARFYLLAAERFPDVQRRNICRNLAAWRARHRKEWARIRGEYSERTGEFGVFDPDNYVLSNPQVMASLTCFATPSPGRTWPTGSETAVQIVQDAIHRAEGALVFYHGLKGFSQTVEAARMIDAMIDEEERHVHLLYRSLETIKSKAPTAATT